MPVCSVQSALVSEFLREHVRYSYCFDTRGMVRMLCQRRQCAFVTSSDSHHIDPVSLCSRSSGASASTHRSLLPIDKCAVSCQRLLLWGLLWQFLLRAANACTTSFCPRILLHFESPL